jgi:hypothetical protein
VLPLVLSLFVLLKQRRLLASSALNLGLFLIGVLSLAHYLKPEFPPAHVYHWAKNRPLTIEGFLYQPAEYLPQKFASMSGRSGSSLPKKNIRQPETFSLP